MGDVSRATAYEDEDFLCQFEKSSKKALLL